jgi:predicted ArsR family transcriptional regulator
MLRALSHPVRLALLDALRDGPLTATQAGAVIGESATTCSFHLRQLAHYGFVEEAGGGTGRARPWRLLVTGWSAPPRPDDPEFSRAARALDHVLLTRHVDRMRTFIDTVQSYPTRWQRAASAGASALRLTAAELTELNRAHQALIAEFRARTEHRGADPQARPRGTRSVEVFFAAYPVDPPGAGR